MVWILENEKDYLFYKTYFAVITLGEGQSLIKKGNCEKSPYLQLNHLFLQPKVLLSLNRKIKLND